MIAPKLYTNTHFIDHTTPLGTWQTGCGLDLHGHLRTFTPGLVTCTACRESDGFIAQQLENVLALSGPSTAEPTMLRDWPTPKVPLHALSAPAKSTR